MKKIFLPILFFICSFITSSFAQNEEKEMENSLKIYSAFQYLPSGNLPDRYLELPKFSYNSTSFAYYRENKNKRKFIEFGLSFSKRSSEGNIVRSGIDTSTISNPPIMFFVNNFPAKSNDLNLGFSFEKGRWIERLSKGNFKIGVGGSARVFAHFSELYPTTTSFFSEKRNQYYLAFGIVPRIRYDVNSKMYLALQFPFELFGLGLDFVEIENPILTKSQQRQGGSSFAIGGEALIRLGLGYNF